MNVITSLGVAVALLTSTSAHADFDVVVIKKIDAGKMSRHRYDESIEHMNSISNQIASRILNREQILATEKENSHSMAVKLIQVKR